MIKSFNSKETEKIWNGIFSKRYSEYIQDLVRKKLRMLNNSYELTDLMIPPSNKLEKLKGERRGQYSIRINNQWRICFLWKNNDCYSVEITDYH
jgi:toxin HigB-1